MPLTLPLPDWVPWWGQLVILVIGVLFVLAFLMMPFAVFGLKGRLDFLEAQLDDIHAELRMLAMRLPDPDRPLARPTEPVVQELAPRAGAAPGAATSRASMPRPQARPAEQSPVERRARELDDWSREPPAEDEDDAPRRPLRVRPPLRDPERGRSPSARTEPPRTEPTRSEPTLRWPPR